LLALLLSSRAIPQRDELALGLTVETVAARAFLLERDGGGSASGGDAFQIVRGRVGSLITAGENAIPGDAVFLEVVEGTSSRPRGALARGDQPREHDDGAHGEEPCDRTALTCMCKG